MSFGFSVGDIILLSQLSYNIYQSITAGRKNASRDLSELGDVLFGLRCALDHLQHVADDMPVANTGTSASRMRSELDLMIRGCAITLEDLDTATKKYREGSQLPNDLAKMSKTERLRARIATNVMKVRWDMDKDNLKVYREKLQSHADAINLVLNTFTWQTATEVKTDGKLHAQQLSSLQDSVSVSHKTLERMLADIHASIMRPPPPPPPPPVLQAVPGTVMMDASPTPPTTSAPKFKAHYNIHRPSGGFPPIAMMALHGGMSGGVGGGIGPGRPGGIPGAMFDGMDHGMGYSMDHTSPETDRNIDLEMHDEAASHVRAHHASIPPDPIVLPTRPKHPPPPKLPPAIQSLNLKRQHFSTTHTAPPKPAPEPPPPVPKRPVFFTTAETTTEDLLTGLDYLFSNQTTTRTTLAHDTQTWVRALNTLLDSPAFKSPTPEQRTSLTDLVVHLNEVLDKAPENLKATFYNTLSESPIEAALRKLVKVTRSVRAEKEVQEFGDVWEEWREEL